MTDPAEPDEPGRTTPAQAREQRSWWPGWIWSVPIAGIAIGVWLLVRFLTQGGTDVTITFPNVYGIDASSANVEYRGMTVGKVTGLSLSDDGSTVEVMAIIKGSAADLLTTGTVFWLRGTHPSLSDLSTLGAVLSGPKIEMEPGPGKPTKHFTGLTHEPVAPPHGGAPVLFTVPFDGDVGGLSPGDPVKLRGFPVGEVQAIGYHFDLETGRIETPVTLALYPSLFHLEGPTEASDSGTLRAALTDLIAKGLRASLERDPPLIGGYRVTLVMVPGAPNASLEVVNGMPEIPTAPASGLASIVARVNEIPVEQISQNVLDLTKQLDQLASSPELKKSLTELDALLEAIRATVKEVGPEMSQLVTSLRDTATQLDEALATTVRTIGSPESQTSLKDTIREVEEAARSIRSLADYLEEHPEALITGKRKER